MGFIQPAAGQGEFAAFDAKDQHEGSRTTTR
jgi:hypothetical protein